MDEFTDEFEDYVSRSLRTSSARAAFDRPAAEVARTAMGGQRLGARRGLWELVGSLAILTVVVAGFGLQFLPRGAGSEPLVGTVAGVDYLASSAYGLRLPIPPQPYGTVTSTDPDLNGRGAYRVGTIDPHAMLIAATDGSAYRLLWGPSSEDAYPEVCSYVPVEQERVLDHC